MTNRPGACVDCKYFDADFMCRHNAAESFDTVFGVGHKSAHISRLRGGSCGPEGKYFEKASFWDRNKWIVIGLAVVIGIAVVLIR